MESVELKVSDPFSSPVGAFVLDTLTVGMYTDARDAIREYIQNSLDGIRHGVDQGLLAEKDGQIEVRQSAALDELVISDNGAGIESALAAQTLLSIGKSSKRIGKNAGFRGIGRLAGIAYCDTLVFETSHAGDETGTRIEFDCAKLRGNFDPNKAGEAEDLETVMRGCCRITDFEAPVGAHFFRVHMKRLKGDGRKFLEFDYLYEYLSQYAPVDYDSQKFMWASEIRKRIAEQEFTVPTVNIELTGDDKRRYQIRKPYRNRHRIHGGDTLEILGVEFFDDPTGEKRYWGWYSKSELLGSIKERESAGLRIRVENILVGGPQLTRRFFASESGSNDRFNNYFVGEIFLKPGLVVPNARRDEFEDTEAWRSVRTELEELAKALSTQVRSSSTNRNKSVSKLKAEVEKIISQADNHKDQGFTSEDDKQSQIAKIEKQFEKVVSARTKDRSTEEAAEIDKLKAKLSRKKDEITKVKSYAVKTLKGVLNKKQDVVLRAVFDVLKTELDEKKYGEIKEKIELRLKQPKKSG